MQNAAAWGSGAFLHIGVAVDRKKQTSKRRDKNFGLMGGGENGWQNQAARARGLWWRNPGSTAIELRLFPPGDPLRRLPSGQQRSRRRRHWMVVVEANTCIGGEMHAIGPVEEAGLR